MSLFLLIFAPNLYWEAALCGIVVLADSSYTFMVNPEQSIPLIVSPPHLYGTPLYLFIELSIDNFIGALSFAGADKRGIFLVFLFATGEDLLFPPLSEVYLGDGFIPAQPDKRVRAIKAAIVILYLFTNPHDQHSLIS